MTKRAFTLIELLVVIAIIAILAAILFPVFAQARDSAKRASGLSNTKQMATGIVIYTTDFDDTFPLAFSRRANGTFRNTTIHPTPANVIGSGWDAPEIVAQVMVQWANSMQIYVRNWDLYNTSAQTKAAIPGEVFVPGRTPAHVGMTYNGLLHGYSATAVEGPSVVPLIWTGMGNVAMTGRSGANPSLACAGAGECRFTPGGPAQAGNAAGNQSPFFGFGNFFPNYRIWTHGLPGQGGVIFARTDTSARFQRVGSAQAPAVNLRADLDPYAHYTGVGAGFAFYATNDNQCHALTAANTGTGFRYACFFRPDRTQ